MKKRILMLTLVLMIVLSSFNISFGNLNLPTSNTIPPEVSEAIAQIQSEGYEVIAYYDENLSFPGDPNYFTYYIRGFKTNGTYGSYNLEYPFQFSNSNWSGIRNCQTEDFIFFSHAIYIASSDTLNTTYNQTSPYSGLILTHEPDGSVRRGWSLLYCTTPIYGIDYNSSTNTGTLVFSPPNYDVTVSIKPSQRILFNYAAADKDKFLKSLSCTPDKSITVHQAYYSGGQVTDLVIKKDTTDLLIGGASLTLASFPSHRALNTNEYLGYSQANGGNWVWTDFIPGSNGGPVGTDSNSLVTFTIDTRYCSYRVVSANTGLEITSGGIADVPQVPDDGIYNNNQNPWGPDDITDDYLLDRADYEDGIIGDIQYGFDTLFKFLKMPFELLYKFIMTLGEIIQYALGTVSGFTTALQGIYEILPGPIWFLVIMAISINVFKLIFGR